jgi:predicted small lipoprotein YifL
MMTMATMTAAIHRQSWVQRLTRSVLALVLAAALMGTLSACGKRGAPEPPPGQKNEYPRNYPNPSTYPPL